jgi:hypothetical protein
LTGQLLYSHTLDPDRPDLLAQWQGQSLSGVAGIAEWDHNGSYVTSLRYTHYSPGFRSWLGFVPRVGYNDYDGYLRKDFFLSSPLVSRLGPYVGYDRLQAVGLDGFEQDPAVGLQVDATKATYIDISFHPHKQALNVQGQERRFRQLQWSLQMTPSRLVPVILFSGTIGDDVDYDGDGAAVPVTNLAATLRLQPFDRLQLEARYTILRLGDAPRGGFRVKETIPEFLATYFFGPAFYAFADVQLDRIERRFPFTEDDRSTLASLQFVWEPRLDWRGYFGVRSGRVHPLDPKDRGKSTEFYVKIVRRFALGGF